MQHRSSCSSPPDIGRTHVLEDSANVCSETIGPRAYLAASLEQAEKWLGEAAGAHTANGGRTRRD